MCGARAQLHRSLGQRRAPPSRTRLSMSAASKRTGAQAHPQTLSVACHLQRRTPPSAPHATLSVACHLERCMPPSAQQPPSALPARAPLAAAKSHAAPPPRLQLARVRSRAGATSVGRRLEARPCLVVAAPPCERVHIGDGERHCALGARQFVARRLMRTHLQHHARARQALVRRLHARTTRSDGRSRRHIRACS
jgi:hypothetical protein